MTTAAPDLTAVLAATADQHRSPGASPDPTADEVPGLAPEPIGSAIPDTGPDTLAGRVEQLLGRHQVGHFAAAVTGLLAPHTADRPTHDGPSASVPTCLVIRLHQLLPGWPVGLPAAVLHAAEPWLRRPEPMFEHPAPEPDPTAVPELNTRELQVLRGMAAGHPNASIAQLLTLSEDTIKTYGRTLFRKLAARDRAHAVDIGWRLRLLP